MRHQPSEREPGDQAGKDGALAPGFHLAAKGLDQRSAADPPATGPQPHHHGKRRNQIVSIDEREQVHDGAQHHEAHHLLERIHPGAGLGQKPDQVRKRANQ